LENFFNFSKNQDYLFAFVFAFVFAGAVTFVFAFPAIESGFALFVFVSTATFVFALVFASTAAFEFVSSAGATGSDESPVVCKTEIFPVKAGIESKSAESIKTVAAMIVNLDKTLAAPRGVNAVLETLLVKSAPASVLPGCKRTAAINTIQETKNNPYKK